MRDTLQYRLEETVLPMHLRVKLNRLMSSQQFISGVALRRSRVDIVVINAVDYSCTKGYLEASDFDCYLRLQYD